MNVTENDYTVHSWYAPASRRGDALTVSDATASRAGVPSGNQTAYAEMRATSPRQPSLSDFRAAFVRKSPRPSVFFPAPGWLPRATDCYLMAAGVAHP